MSFAGGGWDVSNTADGDHVHVLLHLKGSDAVPLPMSSEHRGRDHARRSDDVVECVEMRTPNTAMISTTDGKGRPGGMSTAFLDHIYANAPDVATAAVLKPYARGVCSGTPTSIVFYEGTDAAAPKRRGPFDRTVTHNIAMQLAEQVVAECQARKLQVYAGFGVFNHREGTVVDVCGATTMSSTLLAATSLSPSCSDGTLFPTMQEINVNTQRVSDVLRAAFTELSRLEDRALIPNNATTFLSLTVAVPVRLHEGSMVRMTRLHIVDVSLYSHLKMLARVGTDPAITPWLQRPEDSGVTLPHPLPLLAFGVGLENRCVVHATMPSRMTSRGGASAHDASQTQSLGGVLGTLTKLRTVCVGAETFSEGIGVPPVGPADVVLWRAHCERMRLRRLANTIELDARQTTEALRDEHNDASNGARQQLIANLTAAAKDLLAPDSATQLAPLAGRATWECLRSRIQLARETQLELMETTKRVEQHRRWLMSLPVVNHQGYSVVADHTRSALLERSVMLLQEENKRQRALFSRDIELLQLEVAPMVEAAEAEAAAMPAAQRILQPSWTSFCKELEPLLSKSNGQGDHREVLHQLVRNFADSLEHDAGLMALQQQTHAKGEDTSRVTNDSFVHHQRPSTALVAKEFQMAMTAAMGRALGVPNVSGNVEGLGMWTDVVAQRFATVSDQARLRHTAECFALHIERLIHQTDALLEDLRAPTTSAAPRPLGATSVTATSAGVSLVTRSSSKKTMRERVADALQEEILLTEETSRVSSVAAAHEPAMALTAEKLRALSRAAMSIALGYADGHVSNEPLTVSMMSLLRDRLESDRLDGKLGEPDVSSIQVDNSALQSHSTRVDTVGASDDAKAATFPTLHVSLDDLLQGKRAVRHQGEARASAPRRGGAVQQGHFSTLVAPQKQVKKLVSTPRWGTPTVKSAREMINVSLL